MSLTTGTDTSGHAINIFIIVVVQRSGNYYLAGNRRHWQYCSSCYHEMEWLHDEMPIQKQMSFANDDGVGLMCWEFDGKLQKDAKP